MPLAMESEKDCGKNLKNGECHSIKPFYCNIGELIAHCRGCGCDEGFKCSEETGECSKEETALEGTEPAKEKPLAEEPEIVFIYPNAIQTTETGEIGKIEVEIKNGGELGENMKAVLKTGFSVQEIVLVREESGRYSATLPEKITKGSHTLEIALKDNPEIRGTAKTEVMLPAELIAAITAVSIIVLTIAGIFGINHFRNKFKEKSLLDEKKLFEIRKRKRLLSDLKKEYLRRHLTEVEYKHKVLEVEAEIKEMKKPWDETKTKAKSGPVIEDLILPKK